jgi:hypothetical protein
LSPSKEPREEPERALNSPPAFAGEMSRNETEGEAESFHSPRTRCFKRTTQVDPCGFPLRPRKLGHLPRPKSRGRNQNRGDGATVGSAPYSPPAFAGEMGRGTRSRGGKPNRSTHLEPVASNAQPTWILVVSPSDLASPATSPVQRAEGGTGSAGRRQRGS